ncbi:hypothetical protein V3C99_019001 [Haemonchus contortus]
MAGGPADATADNAAKGPNPASGDPAWSSRARLVGNFEFDLRRGNFEFDPCRRNLSSTSVNKQQPSTWTETGDRASIARQDFLMIDGSA